MSEPSYILEFGTHQDWGKVKWIVLVTRDDHCSSFVFFVFVGKAFSLTKFCILVIVNSYFARL